MRRILWLVILFFGYIWLVNSGKDKLLFEKGKTLLEWASFWAKKADLDFQLPEKKEEKKARRRWD